jgi:hypothetical protein
MGSTNSGASGGPTQGPLTSCAADKLAKVCGLLGSDHDGERSAAALRATAILRDAGWTWRDLVERALAPAPPRAQAANDDPGPLDPDARDPVLVQRRATWTLRNARRLTDKASAFLHDLARRPRPLSPRQAAWLTALEQSARGARGRR